MKKLIKGLSAVIGMLMLSTLVYAKSVTGVAIFNHSVGARQLGMADAAVGLSDDSNAIFYNPGGLSTLTSRELNAMYFDNIVDTRDEALSFVNPLQRGIFGRRAALGIGVKAYQGGSIEVIMADSLGNITSQRTMKAESDYMASVCYAEEILKGVHLGAGLKYIRSTLVEDYSASTVSLDAGLLVETGIKGLSIGVSMLNNGGEMKFIEEGDALPQRTVIGAGYRVKPADKVGLKLGCDYIKEKDDDSRVNLGLELGLANVVMLRTGYYTSSDLGSVTAGIGIRLGMIQLDYGYGLMEELGNLQRVAITMKWGNEVVQEAKKPVRRVVTKKVITKPVASATTTNVKTAPKPAASKTTAVKPASSTKKSSVKKSQPVKRRYSISR